MPIQSFAPRLAALTLWSCLGCVLFLIAPPGSDDAWHVALFILFGQAAIAGLFAMRRVRRLG